MLENDLENTNEKFEFKPRKKQITKQKILPEFDVYDLGDALKNSVQKALNLKPIMGSLVYEGDLTIFWGPSSQGKSGLAYQLAQAIALGKNFFDITGLNDYKDEEDYYRLVNKLDPQPVLYLDFEMPIHKLTRRYSNFEDVKNPITFEMSNNIKVVKFKQRGIKDKGDFIDAIDNYLSTNTYKVIIIDNLTNLSHRGEDAEFSTDLMNKLRDLRDKYELTMLLLAHANKIDEYAIKNSNMLKGSSNFTNLTDGEFCVSPTRRGSNCKYIKQIKNRYDEEEFNTNNVIEIELVKMDNGFFGGVFNGYQKEIDLLTEKVLPLDEAILRLYNEDKLTTGPKLRDQLYGVYGNKTTQKSFETKCKRHLDKIKERNKRSNDDNTITL